MFTASAAKEMTAAALAPEADLVKPYIEHICAKIENAAKKGQREISHPFSGFNESEKWGIPDSAIVESVRKAVEALGFNWTDYSDPDPGDPRSSGYTTITW